MSLRTATTSSSSHYHHNPYNHHRPQASEVSQELILAPETARSLEQSFQKRRQFQRQVKPTATTAHFHNRQTQPTQEEYNHRGQNRNNVFPPKSSERRISFAPFPTAEERPHIDSKMTSRYPVQTHTERSVNTLEAGLAGSHALAAARGVLSNGGTKQQAESVVLSILLNGKNPSHFPPNSSKVQEARTQAKMLVNMAKQNTDGGMGGPGMRQNNLGQALDGNHHRAPNPAADKVKRKKRPEPVRLRINRGKNSWVARGYKAIAPKREGKTYFASLAERRERQMAEPRGKGGIPPRVISICIPCFNEDSDALKRTIESLQRSYLPRGVVLEILVAMDGLQQIHPTMAVYLRSLFGISVNEDDPKKNPFVTFPKANTVVVESTTNTSRNNISLVIKRTNKRKVNSQKWWLYGHATDGQSEFAFATDCGIIFDRKCLMLLVERMDREPNMSGMTGYQRVMPAKAQGDGRFELCTDPMGWFLRLLQSYDFETSQSTTKSVVDTFGFVPVLPGPCSLFRFDHFRGIVDDYFKLTNQPLAGDASDVVLGNVQLAEDRFPPVLLTFRDENNPAPHAKQNRTYTGFEHDAIFYFECEKPLGQLVKQRRRWINGAYMAGYWVLKEKWIKRAKHSMFTKFGATFILSFELIQGFLIRMVVPATLACGLFFMVNIIPPIWFGDVEEVKEVLAGEPTNFWYQVYGGAAMAFYLLVFAIFMFAHTPKAVKMKDENGEVYFEIDTRSAYRPWLFFLSFLVNAILVLMFFYVGVMIYWMIGWKEAPIYFKVLTAMMGVPYVVCLFDGLINSKCPSVRALWNLIWLTPVFQLSSIWFYVWFPAYASARISDLSWGNRAAHQESFASSQVARHRAYLGRVASTTIVLSNWIWAGAIIGIMQFFPPFLTVILFSMLGFNAILLAVNLLDTLGRVVWKKIPHILCGEPPPPLRLRVENIDEEDEENSEFNDDYTLDEYTVDTKTPSNKMLGKFQQQDDDDSSESEDENEVDQPYYGKQYFRKSTSRASVAGGDWNFNANRERLTSV